MLHTLLSKAVDPTPFLSKLAAGHVSPWLGKHAQRPHKGGHLAGATRKRKADSIERSSR